VAASGGSAGEAALAAAGIEGLVEIIDFHQGSNRLFEPGYLVAVDHETGHVVVALRGTSSVRDVLSDLACQPTDVQLSGMDGIAHSGMLTAARRIEAKLAGLVKMGLERLAIETTRVIVVGHSLGAGVSALITALWHDRLAFPGIDLRCVALACPQILDQRLSQAMGNFTTSILLGHDLVPRFSLATANDLRSAILHIHDPQGHGLQASFGSQELLAAEASGQSEQLVQAYVALRQSACRAPGRLFPAGRLVHLQPRPQLAEAEAFDELLLSSDMAAAHMPQRYLKAIQEVGR